MAIGVDVGRKGILTRVSTSPHISSLSRRASSSYLLADLQVGMHVVTSPDFGGVRLPMAILIQLRAASMSGDLPSDGTGITVIKAADAEKLANIARLIPMIACSLNGIARLMHSVRVADPV
jgi:hypothetical protein